MLIRNEYFISTHIYARPGILTHNFLDLAGEHRTVFSIALVGNQIDSGRLVGVPSDRVDRLHIARFWTRLPAIGPEAVPAGCQGRGDLSAADPAEITSPRALTTPVCEIMIWRDN